MAMKHLLLLSLLFVGCAHTTQPTQPTTDTSWRFILVNKGEAYLTAAKYTKDTVIKNGEQVINTDTLYKIRSFFFDSLGRTIVDSLKRPYERWDTVPNALVGIKVKW